VTTATRARNAAGGRRSVWRRLGRLALFVVLVPIVLVPVYWVVPPVSTLMVYNRLFGPVVRDWVPFNQIAPSLVAAVVMAEDGQFCFHHGVDWQELNKVVSDDDGPSRGASTVAMQTVKNLFLWGGPLAYVRKAIEVPLALYADFVWSKRKTMEIYLNIAEWGPGIFGAEAAAQYYFRRPAGRLTEGQSALLVAALPNPHLRNPGRPSARLQSRAATIAARARRAGGYLDCLYPRGAL
jgi:monofunctional biosynthetic peptidoglycan transglycosylase